LQNSTQTLICRIPREAKSAGLLCLGHVRGLDELLDLVLELALGAAELVAPGGVLLRQLLDLVPDVRERALHRLDVVDVLPVLFLEDVLGG